MAASLASLVQLQSQLTKEKADVLDRISSLDEDIRFKNHVVRELEKTLEALRSGSGSGPRTAAEVRGAELTEVSSADSKPAQEASDELTHRLTAALAELSTAAKDQWNQASFEAQFGAVGDGQLAAFLSTLTPEQRLVWELQNPPEISPRLDRRLLLDLKEAGKAAEAEVLVAAAGRPSEAERQYRSLLWLCYHKELNACHAEQGAGGQSLLTLACRNGWCDVASELLERQADVHHRSGAQLTALSAACMRGCAGCTKILLQAAADPKEASKGCSVLTLASCASSTSLELVNQLLAFRADVRQVDPTGRTPLMEAAAAGREHYCQLFLEAGAEVSEVDNEGKTAAQYARRNGFTELATKLEAEAGVEKMLPASCQSHM
ncbi:ANKHD1 [Symbiodinium microadriaticum]|nr:ANKHD1 [Symbiodinium microadriaticum]